MTIIGARSPHQILEGRHDTELAALAAAGRREAFGELVRRHGSAVRGLLRRMGAAPDLADDVAQDAFLLAFEQIADFRGEGAFAGWLKRIAIRLYIRRWKRDRRLDLMAQTPEPQAADANQGDGAAAGRMDLDAALKHLSPAERACVTLCYGGGLSHAEAAEALHIPLGTLKSHIKRGLERLKDRMAPQGELSVSSSPVQAQTQGRQAHV
jgi:RNA polymerase sigma-70 factor (ECF subfamily)